MVPYRSTLTQIERLDIAAARGAQVRSRSRWIEEGESSSAFFLRQEKKCGVDGRISALRQGNGSIVSSPGDLCETFQSFYTSLFSTEPVDTAAQDSLFENMESSLSAGQAKACEGCLSQDECFTALQGMAHNNALGSDNLPMGFYVKFWHVLGADLVLTLNSSFSTGSLSLSQRRGLITLSFKKGDRLEPKNWRPITLLNVDYKIASRALAGRLRQVIHAVVAPDQSCGVPGRYIGENVSFLRDVVHFASSSDVPVAILSLDQEKAFDRVDWSFLRRTLCHMGFGPDFVHWVDVLYGGVQSAVNVNGYLSSFFSLTRGVRQGCPLSPLLYVLYAEVLACNIRANPSISGLALPGESQPLPVISQYADDTTLVVTSDRAITACFNTYSLFEKGSGSRLNLDKCRGLWLGPWKDRQHPPVDLQWCSDKIKVLGIYVGPTVTDEDNWRPRISAVENVLHSWRQRSLSLSGRALIINSLALSRIWYVASMVPMPDSVSRELNTAIFKFFWKGKPDLVSRSTIAQHPFLGGLSVVSIGSKAQALLAQWVKRWSLNPGPWSTLMSFWFTSLFRSSPFEVFSCPFAFAPERLPPFYHALLLAWRSLEGAFCASRASLVIGTFSGLEVSPLSEVSAKSCYLFLLSKHHTSPHCVSKFRAQFGPLYWSSTWQSLSFFPLDRPVFDVAWKIAHGVLYTADRLVSFGYNVPPLCLCGLASETLPHLFFACPLAQSVLSWLQSLMVTASPLCPSLLCRHVLFGFSPDELHCVPRIFVYLLNVCKFYIWHARNDFRFRDVPPSALDLIASVRARVRFHLPLFFRRFHSIRRRRYFLRQWCARGVIASLQQDRLLIHL